MEVWGNTIRSTHASVSKDLTNTLQHFEHLEKEDPFANYKCVEILAKIAADMKSINRKVRNISNKLGEQATRIANIEQCLRNWTPKEGIVTPSPDEMLPKYPAENKKELRSLEKAVKEKKFELQILVSTFVLSLSKKKICLSLPS